MIALLVWGTQIVRTGMLRVFAGLALMPGAAIGTSLIAVAFSFAASWLSPLLIFGGVLTFISHEKTNAGRLGRAAIGLGLILLALHLIVASTKPLTDAPAIRALLAAMPNEVLLAIACGAAARANRDRPAVVGCAAAAPSRPVGARWTTRSTRCTPTSSCT
jgi:Na+/phosphate symporter